MKPSTPLVETFALSKRELDAVAIADPKTGLVDRIFLLVRTAIQSKQLGPGQRLPSIRDVARACDVSRDTATRAYDKLVAHGYLITRPGAGFYVRGQDVPDKRTGVADQSRGDAALPMPEDWRQRLLDPRTVLAGNLGGGNLPVAWINEPQLSNALRSVARGKLNWMMEYEDQQGYLPLRQQLHLKLGAFGVAVDPKQIMTTIGGTDALNLVVMSYLRTPGEAVLVDDPASFLLIDRLLASGLNIIGVPRLHDGPDVEALRLACEHHRPRLFFCNTLLHNPTSTSLEPHKAFQVLQIAQEFDLTIVEDDTYGDLLPANTAPHLTRLATLDQLRRVIYIGSFSKILGVGLRVGYIAASAQSIEWLLRYKSVSRATNGSLGERTVYRLLSEGTYRHHCEQLRARLNSSRVHALEKLCDLDIAVTSNPYPGMYLWGRLPGELDALCVAERMLEAGYLTAPGRLFSQSQACRSYMRFNIAACENETAFRMLAATISRSR